MARIDVDGIYKHSPMTEAQILAEKNDDREIVINTAQVTEAAPASSSDTDRTKYNPSYTCETGSGKVRRNVATLETLGLDGSQATNNNLCGADLIGIDSTETYRILHNATTVQDAIKEIDSVDQSKWVESTDANNTKIISPKEAATNTPTHVKIETTNATSSNTPTLDIERQNTGYAVKIGGSASVGLGISNSGQCGLSIDGSSNLGPTMSVSNPRVYGVDISNTTQYHHGLLIVGDSLMSSTTPVIFSSNTYTNEVLWVRNDHKQSPSSGQGSGLGGGGIRVSNEGQYGTIQAFNGGVGPVFSGTASKSAGCTIPLSRRDPAFILNSDGCAMVISGVSHDGSDVPWSHPDLVRIADSGVGRSLVVEGENASICENLLKKSGLYIKPTVDATYAVTAAAASLTGSGSNGTLSSSGSLYMEASSHVASVTGSYTVKANYVGSDVYCDILTIGAQSGTSLTSKNPITVTTLTGAPITLSTESGGTELSHIKAQGTAIELKSTGDSTHYSTISSAVTSVNLDTAGAITPTYFHMSGNDNISTASVSAKNITLLAAIMTGDTGTPLFSAGTVNGTTYLSGDTIDLIGVSSVRMGPSGSSPVSFTMLGNSSTGVSSATLNAKTISISASQIPSDTTGTSSVFISNPPYGSVILNSAGFSIVYPTLPVFINTSDLRLPAYAKTYDTTDTHKILTRADTTGSIELASTSDLTLDGPVGVNLSGECQHQLSYKTSNYSLYILDGDDPTDSYNWKPVSPFFIDYDDSRKTKLIAQVTDTIDLGSSCSIVAGSSNSITINASNFISISTSSTTVSLDPGGLTIVGSLTTTSVSPGGFTVTAPNGGNPLTSTIDPAMVSTSSILAASASAPSNPSVGQMYYDTTLSDLRLYKNNAWESVKKGGMSEVDWTLNWNACLEVLDTPVDTRYIASYFVNRTGNMDAIILGCYNTHSGDSVTVATYDSTGEETILGSFTVTSNKENPIIVPFTNPLPVTFGQNVRFGFCFTAKHSDTRIYCNNMLTQSWDWRVRTFSGNSGDITWSNGTLVSTLPSIGFHFA